MATAMRPSLSQPGFYHHHPRSPSSPPPRAFSPNNTPATSPLREQTEKERDTLLWQAQWRAYEDRKANWAQQSWAEYEKRKQAETKLRWKEYEASKKDLMKKRTEVDPNGKQPKATVPPPQEPMRARSSSQSRPPTLDRSAPIPLRTAAPIAPTPIRSQSLHRTAKPSFLRSVTPQPPATTRSPPASPTAPRFYSASNTPTRAATTPQPYQRFVPSPVPAPDFGTRSASPIPRVFFTTPPSSRSSSRSRSNTNPTQPKPQIFVPKPNGLSDGDAFRKADGLPVEERQRRLQDEQRRMEQAAEHARQKAEAERLRRQQEEAVEREHQKFKEEQRQHAQDYAKKLAREHTHRRTASESKMEVSEEAARQADARRIQQELAILEHQNRLVRGAWEAYEDRWKALYDGQIAQVGASLSFKDIPWPVVGEIRSVGELDRHRLEGFLLWDNIDGRNKAMKQRVRDAMLRFHPDRFEGRWMDYVRESDRAAVKDGVGRVVRFLNEIALKA